LAFKDRAQFSDTVNKIMEIGIRIVESDMSATVDQWFRRAILMRDLKSLGFSMVPLETIMGTVNNGNDIRSLGMKTGGFLAARGHDLSILAELVQLMVAGSVVNLTQNGKELGLTVLMPTGSTVNLMEFTCNFIDGYLGSYGYTKVDEKRTTSDFVSLKYAKS